MNSASTGPLENQSFSLKTVGLLLILAAATASVFLRCRALEAEDERLLERIKQLDPDDVQLSQASMVSYDDQRYIRSVMQFCRVANDIPRFDCSRIIMQKKGRQGSMFYVPKGSHKLRVIASWQAQEPGALAIDVLFRDPPEMQRKMWSIELPGDHGYFCQWLCKETPGSIGWRLTSNSERFEAVSHFLPLIDFAQTDLGWTNGGTEMRFPNALMGDDRSNRPAATVSFGRWDRIGKDHEGTWHVRFEAEIVSNAPAVICAQGREWYEELNGEEAIGSYVGDGRFLLLEI